MTIGQASITQSIIMYVVNVFTGEKIKRVYTIDDGISNICSLEKEAEMYGWDKPCLEIVDENGNSVY